MIQEFITYIIVFGTLGFVVFRIAKSLIPSKSKKSISPCGSGGCSGCPVAKKHVCH